MDLFKFNMMKLFACGCKACRNRFRKNNRHSEEKIIARRISRRKLKEQLNKEKTKLTKTK